MGGQASHAQTRLRREEYAMTTNRTSPARWAIVALTVVGLAGCAPIAPASGGSTTPSTPSTVPTSAATEATVAVYFLGLERHWREADGQQVELIKLYREFHRVPAGDGGLEAKTLAAVAAMLAGDAFDPDYRTGWPNGAKVRSVAVGDDAVTVDLAGAATNSVGAEAAQQTVQQLVWTATAASGRSSVRLLLDGEPVSDLWGHVGVGGALRRAPALDTLALVWLIDPQHGATVGRTVTIHVSGSTFESTIQLRVRQGDRTVAERHVTTASTGGGQFGEAKTTLALSPGSYVIEAYAESAVDGRPTFLDDHSVTVA
jgi:hypothetical protein